MDSKFLVIFGMLAFIFLCICGGLYLLYKVLCIIKEREEKKFKDDKSRFMSDLYVLINKYSKRGCADFCNALYLVIEGFNLPTEEQPTTEYGKAVKKQIEKLETDEL